MNFSCACGEEEPLIIEDWAVMRGETWVVSGDNDSRKEWVMESMASFPAARIVSFASAARLIEYERKNDDSDFVEGGVSAGRTAGDLLFPGPDAGGISREGESLFNGLLPSGLLNRGIKYLSTGETRRVLLCEALLSRPELLVLEDPFDGLDEAGQKAVCETLRTYSAQGGTLILFMDRVTGLPFTPSGLLYLRRGQVAYQGAFEGFTSHPGEGDPGEKPILDVPDSAERGHAETPGEILAELRSVTVQWSGRKVIHNLSWTLRRGENWLIRGPNGSGKTTFLELITGDNPQVYANDVRIFGRPRGSGETIWELKERMGIVSYRLHVEYRLVGDIDLEGVVLSGLHDSIGLYAPRGEEERLRAAQWLAVGGFEGRETQRFSDLSYGEQRSLLILRAMVKHPEILILDEPCHGLDDVHRALVLKTLQAVGSTGKTSMLHVTHDRDEMLPCEGKILEFRPGENPMYRILDREVEYD